MMDNSAINKPNVGKGIEKFSYWKVFVPVIIGVAVVLFMFIKDAENQNLSDVWRNVEFSTSTIAFIALAWVFMFGRDFGLSWRFSPLD